MSDYSKKELELVETSLNYVFKNKGLLLKSLTHTSFSHENNLNYDYENLEFLGDAVIELLVSDYLFRNYPKMAVGDMSRVRAYVVKEQSLSKIARNIKLHENIFLGRGELLSGKGSKDSIISDIFEAVCGAMYLEGGYDAVLNSSVTKLLSELLEVTIKENTFFDEKSRLQEYSMKRFSSLPKYEIVSESGREHDKTYVVSVFITDKYKAQGEGKSKRNAEKDAAVKLLKIIDSDNK